MGVTELNMLETSTAGCAELECGGKRGMKGVVYTRAAEKGKYRSEKILNPLQVAWARGSTYVREERIAKSVLGGFQEGETQEERRFHLKALQKGI